MNCNCNNKTYGALIKHVYGNVLRLAIPLTVRTIELVERVVDGETTQDAVATDTEFIPSSEHPVTVVLSRGATKISIDATMDGNMACVEDQGKIPVGTYDITITCRDASGNPYRFNQDKVLEVVNATAEAGIFTPIEYEVKTYHLSAAIFLALKGNDGVGIADIITRSSSEEGGANTVTIVLTDGRTRSFTIMNGGGGSPSGYQVSYNDGDVVFTGSVQPTYDNGNIIF